MAKDRSLHAKQFFQSFSYSPDNAQRLPRDEWHGEDDVVEDDDVPLDAFDRELLAQLEAGTENQNCGGAAARPANTSSHPLKPFATPETGLTRSTFFKKPQQTPARKPALWAGQGNLPDDDAALSSPLVVGNLQSKPRPPSFKPLQASNSRTSLESKPAAHPFSPSPMKPPTLRPFSSPEPEERNTFLQPKHAPQTVQGIQLVSAHELPDRLCSVFPFHVFNAVQSKSFRTVYNEDCNFVLSSPTGSGKTVVMELAICRLLTTSKTKDFKIIYQAPTKSLCSERFRDWQAKFAPLDLPCAELTGDTDFAQLRHVQHANIIITTPEKWDSMTRKWKDHFKLMQLVKLFLIDEVHILRETRGATLEAVVSRMKSMKSMVRFVALSATVPNAEDIASWLGRDALNPQRPAHLETFGDSFRPVRLEKFVYGYHASCNDFAFDKLCDSKLPEIIAKHSQRKPILIFCSTRKSAIATAKSLAKLWAETSPQRRLWKASSRNICVQDNDLKGTIIAGVAFHHAGLPTNDRRAVEDGFLQGHVNVICCTSTLAVGINLPCYLVIIKNTVSWQENGCRQYPDLEVIQMLGRAGRPQFDTSATAVILTRKDKVEYYEKLVAGTEPLESCLHTNLIDHLNAEIGLGTITDVESAIRWLTSTFFFIRLRKNPRYYQLKDGADHLDEENLLRATCEKDILLLQETRLVASQGKLRSTELGDAMARYYVKFETMRLLLSLPPKASVQEILSTLCKAEEFHEIRLKAGEKSLYKEINKGSGIKFPIKIDIGLPAQKISLLIQAELGGVEIPPEEQYQKHKLTFQQDKALVFSHANRLIRCIIDCNISLGDAVATRHALDLARSIGARVWDNSPLQLKQIEGLGAVAVRKLATGGITTIEALESADTQRVDMLLSKNPPFAAKLLAKLGGFPKPMVYVVATKKDIKQGQAPKLLFKATVGFMNDKPPLYFRKKPIYLCFLAETSDGRLIEFRRIGAAKLQKFQEIHLVAELTEPSQSVACSVMCDEIAGTMRRAELNHDIPSSFFPPPGKVELSYTKAPGISSQPEVAVKAEKEISPISPFRGDDIDDDEFLASIGRHINTFDDVNIDTYEDIEQPADSVVPKTDITQPSSCLPNGKWPCLHKCRDKTSCKHFCCREGLDRPPKLNRRQSSAGTHQDRPVSKRAKVEAPLAQPLQPLKKVRFGKKDIDLIDLTKTTSDDSLEEELRGYNAITRKDKLSHLTSQEEPLNVTIGDAREGAPIATDRVEEETSEPFSSSFGSPSLNTSLTTLPSSSTLKTEKFQSRDMTTKETGCQRTTDYDNQLAVPQSFPEQSDKDYRSPFQVLPEMREQPYKDTPLTPDLPTKLQQLPAEWQGLDPELYEEFGDLVELI